VDGGGWLVGETLTTQGRTITESDIVMFAGLTGDWHPQHTDALWAATSLFKDRIAHGLLVVSSAVGLVPLDPKHVVAVRRADAIFKRPVNIGDTVHVEATVRDREWLDGPFWNLRCLWKIVNQHGRIVTKVTVDLLWREESEHNGAGGAESLVGAASEEVPA
jgi:acyl dehydratase